MGSRRRLADMDPEPQEIEAVRIARRFLKNADLRDVSWLGASIADGWFLLREGGDGEWGGYDADGLLVAMVDASAEDWDAWHGLSEIAARLHEDRRPFPDTLAEWAARVHRGEIEQPRKRQSKAGMPPYAARRRGMKFAGAFYALRSLGVPEGMAYYAIGAAAGKSDRTVERAITSLRRDHPPWVLFALDGYRTLTGDISGWTQ